MKSKLKKKYKIKAKGLEDLKQGVSAKTLNLKHCKSRVKQYQQDRTFKNNQNALHEELNGKMRQEQVILDAEESIKFCRDLWVNPVGHDRNDVIIHPNRMDNDR